MSGRSGRVPDTRELVISDTPFIAAYTIDQDRIVVLAIYHGAQQWPEVFSGTKTGPLSPIDKIAPSSKLEGKGGWPLLAVFEKWASPWPTVPSLHSDDGPVPSCYHNRMSKPKKFDLENPAPVIDDEDEETLAAIDEGMRDAEAGRTVPAEEVRRLLPKWTTASSTPKRR